MVKTKNMELSLGLGRPGIAPTPQNNKLLGVRDLGKNLDSLKEIVGWIEANFD
jgi:hypothetical protein